MISFWLANTSRLLHCLKQYSGDEVSPAPCACPPHPLPLPESWCLCSSGLHDPEHCQAERALPEEL